MILLFYSLRNIATKTCVDTYFVSFIATPKLTFFHMCCKIWSKALNTIAVQRVANNWKCAERIFYEIAKPIRKPMQDERAFIRDSKYILHEILD